MTTKAFYLYTVLAAVVLALAGCSSGSDGGSSAKTGSLSLSATDAPVDHISRVQITFDKVVLQPSGGGDRVVFKLDPVVTIDNLLAFTGNDSKFIVQSAEVPAGKYNFVRLYIAGGVDGGSLVETRQGEVYGLFLPGQQPAGNKLPQANKHKPGRFLQLNAADNKLIVPAGGAAEFTIDFDLRAGLTRPASADYYLLHPTVRLINETQADAIKGEVMLSLARRAICTDGKGDNAVYLYAGSNQMPGDINLDFRGQQPQPDHDTDNTDGKADEVSPLTTAEVIDADNDQPLEYTIGFVEEGDYTIAFTCQADQDDPETDDAIEFAGKQNVTVSADDPPEQVDFGAQPS